MNAAISAWVAEKCNRVSGQESAEDRRILHADLARDAKFEELGASKCSEVFGKSNEQDVRKAVFHTRWALTR